MLLLINFEISKIHTFTLRTQTLIVIPRKSTTFFEIDTWNLVVMFKKLEQNLLIKLNFDLVIRSSNIAFFKLLVQAKTDQKSRFWIRYVHFWGLNQLDQIDQKRLFKSIEHNYQSSIVGEDLF